MFSTACLPHLEPKPACGVAGAALQPTPTPFSSIKQPEQMIEFAALSLCSEKPERMPTLSCNPPLGGGYSPQTPTKQPTK